ncbi:MAG: dTDP-4-amino-4,6-dideoxygalactose transaminase, partial [Spirochaetota bacterium]|nr:dTDP-4-amino-4,6-dideoxygalactose transaminase [Spirochaetota bacterium]
MIPFNRFPYTGKELEYIQEVLKTNQISGDGLFTKKCHQWFEENVGCKKALLTTSCTHALEMSAILADIQAGDEVILPSFTFTSTANAYVLRGATLVFVDIRPDTMNMDESIVEQAVTEKTKAIIPVHYASVGCEMDRIMDIARDKNITVIEDSAQGMMGSLDGKTLGSIGDMGCYSFHESKNYSCGEGGVLLINNERFIKRAEIIREKGTNRSQFFRGEIDKYSWIDMGSSYLPSELNAAYLFAQLEKAEKVKEDRLRSWQRYYDGLKGLADNGLLELPYIPPNCQHNAHMFYVKVKDKAERTRLIQQLKANEISAVFHYIPLHSSVAGQRFGRFFGEDKYSSRE